MKNLIKLCLDMSTKVKNWRIKIQPLTILSAFSQQALMANSV
jgi:hypothetical protein